MRFCKSKTCTQSNPQPLENFSKSNTRGDGYQNECKVCKNASKKIWYQKNIERCRKITREYGRKHREQVKASTRQWAQSNPEKVRDYHLRKKYGVTLAQYNELLALQNNQCAICGAEHGTRRKSLFVDHCHDTKKVRGLLCYYCNLGLGLFKESAANIENALLYIKKNTA